MTRPSVGGTTRTSRRPARLVTLVAFAALPLAPTGCTPTCAVGGAASADCDQQVEYRDTTYTQTGQRVRDVEPLGEVTEVACDDTGCTTDPSDYDTRRAWTVAGFDADEVLAVRSGRRAFEVFLADSLDRDETERILGLIDEQARPRP